MRSPRPPREKLPLESKKFISWLISETGWKLVLLATLWIWRDNPDQISTGAWWFLLSIVVTAGFIGIGFILGQAALDKYVRVAEIAAEEIRDRLHGGTEKASIDPQQPDPGSSSTSDDPTDPKVNP